MLLSVLLVAASVFASNSIFGVLKISKVDGRYTPLELGVNGDQISVSFFPAVFEYDRTGTLRRSFKNDFLGVNETGQLVVSKTPQTGFVLRSGKNPKKTKLFLNETKIFYLCEDDSISFFSTCRDARKVEITFEDALR
ncbi:hypothetical protein OXX80_001297 [Metschnikowia pulcherrima]